MGASSFKAKTGESPGLHSAMKAAPIKYSRTPLQMVKSKKIEILSKPIQSESDKKDYHVITLSNGLIATLVSNPPATADTPEFAACALTVEVGSFSDPEEVQGLAHLLEHVILTGSKKYPKENAFDSFLIKYAGEHNASTEGQYTTFHFQCLKEHFFKAMQMFASYFTNPSLKWESIHREREAVESEFQDSIMQDDYRLNQLTGSLASPQNPILKFPWGNQHTLMEAVSEKQLHKAVIEFRKSNYTANRMKLAVQAGFPLEVLAERVVKYFSKVPSASKPAMNFGPLDLPFNSSKFHGFYFVDSIEDVAKLKIQWALPSVIRLYKTKPLVYLSFLIGHEGEGSLLSYLKSKFWAVKLNAGINNGNSQNNDLFTIFSIDIILTDEGRSVINDVLTAVFSYLKMLMENGPDEKIYEEIKHLAEVKFRFQENRGPKDTVIELTQSMLIVTPEDYLTSTELYFDFAPEEITSFLRKMSPTTVNIMLSSKTHSCPLDQEEFWFKTKYTSEAIDDKWIEKWTNVDIIPEFNIPNENPFIPTDFALIDHSDVQKYPQKVRDTNLIEIWYKGDSTFLLPVASIDMLILTSKTLQKDEYYVYLDIFLKILKFQLAEELYPAKEAGYDYTIYPHELGLHISISGYNQHINAVFDCIGQAIARFNTTSKETLDIFKELLARSYFNETQRPDALARTLHLEACASPHVSPWNKYRHVKDVELSQLSWFVNTLFRYVHFQVLLQGNISMTEGEAIVDKFVETLQISHNLLTSGFQEYRIRNLQEGEVCIRTTSLNPSNPDSMSIVYFQLGPGSIEARVALELLVVIIEGTLSDQLRNHQQLGYDVNIHRAKAGGILGLSISVQSQVSKFTMKFVKEQIDNFVKQFVDNFPLSHDEDFEDYRNSMIQRKKSPYSTLRKETDRNFEEIARQEFIFDRLEREIDILKKITKTEIYDLAKTLISPENEDAHKLVVQVEGHPQQIPSSTLQEEREHTLPEDVNYELVVPDEDGEYVINFEEWKAGIPEFPTQITA